MTRHHLLDASALLALIFDEPGSDRVQELLDDCEIHAVNLAEAARKLVSLGIPPKEVRTMLDQLDLHVISDLSNDEVFAVGALGAEAKRLGLSLGDCICLAVAEGRSKAALSAERVWMEVRGCGARVVQIR